MSRRRRLVSLLIVASLSVLTSFASASSSTSSTTSEPSSAEAETDEEQRPVIPHLTIHEASPDHHALRVTATLANTNAPARFRLRTENGCTRNATIEASPIAIVGSTQTLALAMHEAELADAFACVVDAEVGDTTFASVAVTPDATTIGDDGDDDNSTSKELRIDTFSVASIDLEPNGGQLVRIAIISDGPVASATLSIGSERAAVRIQGESHYAEDVEATRILFEVPSRVWARAVLEGSNVGINVTSPNKKTHAMKLHPIVRVELLDEDEPGC